MSKSIRGSRMGAISLETDSGADAQLLLVPYLCVNGHTSTKRFWALADEIPRTWLCACGAAGIREGSVNSETKTVKVPKTHYDMLMERRTKGDLSELLSERVNLLRKPKKAS